jgi:hypothetical protein
MLVAAIDRNRASEDDKFVARVLSSLKSTPIAKNKEPSNFRRRIPSRKDTITQGSQSSPSFQIGSPDYIVSLSKSAKKMLQETESSSILN